MLRHRTSLPATGPAASLTHLTRRTRPTRATSSHPCQRCSKPSALRVCFVAGAQHPPLHEGTLQSRGPVASRLAAVRGASPCGQQTDLLLVTAPCRAARGRQEADTAASGTNRLTHNGRGYSSSRSRCVWLCGCVCVCAPRELVVSPRCVLDSLPSSATPAATQRSSRDLGLCPNPAAAGHNPVTTATPCLHTSTATATTTWRRPAVVTARHDGRHSEHGLPRRHPRPRVGREAMITTAGTACRAAERATSPARRTASATTTWTGRRPSSVLPTPRGRHTGSRCARLHPREATGAAHRVASTATRTATTTRRRHRGGTAAAGSLRAVLAPPTHRRGSPLAVVPLLPLRTARTTTCGEVGGVCGAGCAAGGTVFTCVCVCVCVCLCAMFLAVFLAVPGRRSVSTGRMSAAAGVSSEQQLRKQVRVLLVLCLIACEWACGCGGVAPCVVRGVAMVPHSQCSSPPHSCWPRHGRLPPRKRQPRR